MKACLNRNVYSSPTLQRDRQASIERLTRMFEFLVENPDRLPASDEETVVPLERAVCDYIAGMTDRYFFRVYEKFFGSVYMLF